MQWCQEFESGLPEIDRQHQQTFALIQRVREGLERSGIRDVLIELEQLTRHHFDCEERLMVEYDYPAMVRHVAEHATLLREVQSYQDNAVFSPRRLNQVLCNWLTSHSIAEDRLFAHHVLKLRGSTTDKTPVAEVVAGVESAPRSGIRSKMDDEAKLAIGQ